MLHFHLLLDCLIADINNTSISEINIVYACILFKCHGKEKTSDRSYRAITTCPVVAKALDLYIRDMHIHSWYQNQATNQFQGEGSSQLAAVLLTETIQHYLFTLKQTFYVLFLDAQSVVDVVFSELLVKNLFFCNISGHSLLYLNNRFQNIETFIDWQGHLMGPINDQYGLEQGGVSSLDHYKIYGKDSSTQPMNLSLEFH